ncbi:class B sortase [Neobacillus vireti]|uniref:class B sortase n=1 Tax=Neobacillus vireti TaxID=220686 RepID=UPI002FFDF135
MTTCLVVIVYSAYSLISQIDHYHKSAKKYEAIQKIYDPFNKKEKKTSSKKTEDSLKALKRINKDCIGWIRIDDTKINYPVVKGDDNHFYLRHNFRKEPDFVGTIFMDNENSANKLNQHTILYGHNMKDKSMFGSLKDYQGQRYYQKHKFIRFNFQGRTYKWEIFSIYFANNTKLLKTEFSNEQEFITYMNKEKHNSIFSIPVSVEQNDRVLTLSTCAAKDKGKRMIVHAKLLTGE